jgi:hypothetical protein
MPTFRNTLFHFHSQVGVEPAYEDGTECSETSAYKIQTPGNYPEENMTFFSIRFLNLSLFIYCEKIDMFESLIAPEVFFATLCIKGKVKVTLVQALRLCTGPTARRGCRCIALLYRH